MDFFYKVMDLWNKDMSRLSLVFAAFFFTRCALLHFGYKGVPNPWIIDYHWYFGTALGVVIVMTMSHIFQAFNAIRK